jgi:NCS1 nucleoside transporter family
MEVIMSEHKTDYGIEEAVPASDRHYSFWDMAAVWMGANCHPSSWWIGGVIAAAGFTSALKVNLIVAPLSALIVALIAYIGFKTGTTSIGISRIPLGIRGSNAAGSINGLVAIGWAAISCFLGAITMSYIFAAIFGTPTYGQTGSNGIMIFGVLICGLLSMAFVSASGSRSIAIGEKVLAVLLLLMSGWITVVVFQSYDLKEIIAWIPDTESILPFGLAVDALMAYSIGWVLSACEFTRYAKKKSASTIAPGLGLTVALWWFVLVGSLGTIAVAIKTGIFDPNMSDPSSLAAGLGMGWVAFFVILFAVVSTNLINIYVAAYSIMNLFPKLDIKPALHLSGILTVLVGLIPIAVGSFFHTFEMFLVSLGALLPPLAAIIIVDFYIIRKKDYRIEWIGDKSGPYWYKNGFNAYAFAAWILGFTVNVFLSKIGFGANTIGAFIPSMFLSALIYLMIAKWAISRKAYKDVDMIAAESSKERTA